MYCTRCGEPLAVDTASCRQCGQRVPRFSAPPEIPNHLVEAIVVTLCCCLPLGIVAIVHAAQVSSRLAAGDVAGARNASARAKTWSWVTFGAGILFAAIYIITMVFGEFPGS